MFTQIAYATDTRRSIKTTTRGDLHATDTIRSININYIKSR